MNILHGCKSAYLKITPVARLFLWGLGFENIFKTEGIFKISFVFQVFWSNASILAIWEELIWAQRNEKKSRESGAFTFHGSLSKRAVQIFERNIAWLKIEVGDFWIHSTVQVKLTFEILFGNSFRKNRLIFGLEKQSGDWR